MVIVTIADYQEKSGIEKKLLELNIECTTIESFLSDGGSDIVERNRKYIADYHLIEMEDYFAEAESEKSIQIFWARDSEFRKLFLLLNLNNVVELACGRGRHVPQYIDLADQIVLVDILNKNISYCKERFGNSLKVQYYVNNGHDLKQISSNSQSALFSYDAMVHFEMLDIFEYLKETKRILKTGGRALFHHSNNTEDYRITFSTGT